MLDSQDIEACIVKKYESTFLAYLAGLKDALILKQVHVFVSIIPCIMSMHMVITLF